MNNLLRTQAADAQVGSCVVLKVSFPVSRLHLSFYGSQFSSHSRTLSFSRARNVSSVPLESPGKSFESAHSRCSAYAVH